MVLKNNRIFATDDFDLVVLDISSLSVEGNFIGNGIVYQVKIVTKAGETFMWPSKPVKTKEKAAQLKTKLRDALFSNDFDFVSNDSV